MPASPVSQEKAQDLRERVQKLGEVEGAFSVQITDQELTSYVVGLLQSGAGEFPARDMQIRFADGYVDLWATFVDIAPTELPVYARATVSLRDGALTIGVAEAAAGPLPIPGALREFLARILSDTLAEVETGVRFDSVDIRSGQMTIAGRVTGAVPRLP